MSDLTKAAFEEYRDRCVRELRAKVGGWEPDLSVFRPKPPAPKAPWADWTVNAVCAARKRARLKKWEFNLTSEWARKKLAHQEYRCALSGVEFSERKVGGSWKRPWRPSLDRIDAKRGYTKDNVRIVCVAVNTLLHDWGDEVFRVLLGRK